MLAGLFQHARRSARFNVPLRRRGAQRVALAALEPLEHRQLLSATLNFAAAKNFSVGGGPDSVVLADVNGDGFKDIITANYNGTVSVLLGLGNGSFKPAITFPDGLGAGIASATFNSSFLVVTNNNPENQAAVLASNGDGSFQTPSILTLNNPVSTATVADVNGDGKPDLLVGYSNGGVSTIMGNGSGVFQNAPATTTFTVANMAAVNNRVTSLLIGDFYASAVPDIVVGDANGSVSLFQGNLANGSATFGGTFNNVAKSIASNGATSVLGVMSADVNGDGKPDLITTGYNGDVNVFLSNGSQFMTPTSVNATNGVVAGSIGDLNGDGTADLVLANYSTGQVNVLDQNSNGTFANTGSFNAGGVNGSPDSVQLADLNGDGRMDIVTANYGSNTVSVLVNSSTIPPKITNTNNPTFVTGVAGSFLINTLGFPSGTVSTSSKLPAGLLIKNLGNGTAMLMGTPGVTAGGVFPLTFSATNAAGTGATHVFTVTIDQPRKFTSATSATFTTGVAKTFTITTTGFPEVNVGDQNLTLPTGLTFTANNDGTATITGTAASGTEGTFPIVLTSGNGIGGGPTQKFTLIIDQAPAFSSAASDTFTVGTAVTFPITTTGFPLAGVTEVGVLPLGIHYTESISTGGGTLSGTPLIHSGKTYTLSFTATNALGVVHQTFTLTVDEAPSITTAATHATFSTTKAGTFAISASAFPIATITESGGTGLPTGVQLIDNSNNTAELVGTPTATGTFTFTLSASNGVGTTSEVFTLLVT